MASRRKSTAVVARPSLLATERTPGVVWAGWTPQLREQASALAAAACTHAHKPEYASCMGCAIRAKANVRFVNGGPSSAEVAANKQAKAAAKAALAPAVAQAPVGAPAQTAASIGFRPRAKKGTSVPSGLIDPNTLNDPEAIRKAIEGLVARYKQIGGTAS